MNKYIMQKSSTRPNGWVLTDKENGIVVTFEDVKHIPEELARIMRELGEWVVRHHGSKCFNQPYGIEYSEDDTKCFLYRKKSPQWRLEIMNNVDKVYLADSLRKAAEWLTKR
ncbi:DNA breaking-rejoining protein [Prevotella melaninogenica]